MWRSCIVAGHKAVRHADPALFSGLLASAPWVESRSTVPHRPRPTASMPGVGCVSGQGFLMIRTSATSSFRSDERVAPRVLIIVQNLPVPLDRRVWLECQALAGRGYRVSVICPQGPGDKAREVLDGVAIYRYRPAPEAK